MEALELIFGKQDRLARRACLGLLAMLAVGFVLAVYEPVHATGSIVSSATCSASAGSCNVTLSGLQAGDIIVATINGIGVVVNTAYCTGTYALGATDTSSNTWATTGYLTVSPYNGAESGYPCSGYGVFTTVYAGAATDTVTPSMGQMASVTAVVYDTRGYGSVSQAVSGVAGFGVVSTQTTTDNVNAIGTAPNNGTGNYVAKQYLYFYPSQNTATPGLIDNVTMYIEAVHIKTSTAPIYIATYVGNTIAPSSGNQYTLLQTSLISYNLINGSTDFYIHANPQATVCASCFFAVGFYVNATKSNSASVTGSGVSVAMQTSYTEPEYQYNVGTAQPPTTMYSSTLKTSSHWDWLYVHETYTIAISTSTTTINMATTVTTLTTLDENNAINGVTNYSIALMLIIGPGLLLGVSALTVTKGAIGFSGFAILFAAGVAIGTGLAVQAQMATGPFEALAVIVIVFMGAMGFLGMQRGG